MSKVQKGAPSSTKTAPSRIRRPEIKEVVAAAAAEPGEWFSIPLDGMKKPAAYGILAAAVGRHFAEVTNRGERMYIRVRT